MVKNLTFARLNGLVSDASPVEIFGRVSGVRGLLVEVAGPLHEMNVGTRLSIESAQAYGAQENILCEVVGFEGKHAICLPFSSLEGVRLGCPARILDRQASIKPTERWLGRVVLSLIHI